MNSIYTAASIARETLRNETIDGKDLFEYKILPVVNYVHEHFGRKPEIIKLLCVSYLTDVCEYFNSEDDFRQLEMFSEDVRKAVSDLYRWDVHSIKESKDVLVRCVFEAVCRTEMDYYIRAADFESAKYFLNCLCLMENPNEQ